MILQALTTPLPPFFASISCLTLYASLLTFPNHPSPAVTLPLYRRLRMSKTLFSSHGMFSLAPNLNLTPSTPACLTSNLIKILRQDSIPATRHFQLKSTQFLHYTLIRTITGFLGESIFDASAQMRNLAAKCSQFSPTLLPISFWPLITFSKFSYINFNGFSK